MRSCPQCGLQHPDSVEYCSVDGTKLSTMDTVPPDARGLPYQPGQVLGSYRLVDLIGEGGMGFVYLAEHTRLGRQVALKVLRSEYADNPSAVRRFFGEARAVNQINHENIVQITDFIEQPGSANYYIMELLEGNNLSHLITDHGAMSPHRAMAITLQVAKALDVVHGAGTIHRDLKSENIILIERGGQPDFVKLLDFGLAKLFETVDGKPMSQTAEGAILGTPEYMSPEQAAGKKVDHRTDIYSLGVVLYEMVTGKKPFTGSDLGDLVIQHLTTTPARPAKRKDARYKIPKGLDQLIMDCLGKEPDQRPQAMREVVQRLRKIGESESVQLEAFSLAPPVGSRRSLLVALGLAVLMMAGTGVGLYLWVEANGKQARAATGQGLDPVTKPEQPPLPEKVKVVMDSSPPGALVFDPVSQTQVGKTPITLAFERSSLVKTFEFRLDGHKPVQQKVTLLADAQVVVTLAKMTVKKPPKKKRRRKKTATPGSNGKGPDNGKVRPEDREGTVDPFAD